MKFHFKIFKLACVCRQNYVHCSLATLAHIITFIHFLHSKLLHAHSKLFYTIIKLLFIQLLFQKQEDPVILHTYTHYHIFYNSQPCANLFSTFRLQNDFTPPPVNSTEVSQAPSESIPVLSPAGSENSLGQVKFRED